MVPMNIHTEAYLVTTAELDAGVGRYAFLGLWGGFMTDESAV